VRRGGVRTQRAAASAGEIDPRRHDNRVERLRAVTSPSETTAPPDGDSRPVDVATMLRIANRARA
jgi:hypothetical protein